MLVNLSPNSERFRSSPSSLAAEGIHFLLLLKQSFDVAEEELLDKQTDDDDDDDAKIVVMLSERAREIARVSREHVSFLRWLFVDKMEFFLRV